jgi:transposase InsO family protein
MPKSWYDRYSSLQQKSPKSESFNFASADRSRRPDSRASTHDSHSMVLTVVGAIESARAELLADPLDLRFEHAATTVALLIVRFTLCESFFATLECDLLARRPFKTQVEARMAVFEFIEGWYNPHRRHSALDYLSPVGYERSHHLQPLTPNSSPSTETGQLHISATWLPGQKIAADLAPALKRGRCAILP